jgi:hypothetical protein
MQQYGSLCYIYIFGCYLFLVLYIMPCCFLLSVSHVVQCVLLVSYFLSLLAEHRASFQRFLGLEVCIL